MQRLSIQRPSTRRRRSLALIALFCAVAGGARADARDGDAHRFAIVGHGFTDGGEKRLEQALRDNDDDDVDFLVVTGVKGVHEPCSDRLYQKRRELIDEARRPVVLLPAGSDWAECRNSAGRSNAIERLSRMRELFYAEPATLGKRKLALTRLSMSPRFRSYAENAHWSIGKVMYATVNMPANNNHYLNEAGRNSEYEDRLVANRFWLHRLFAIAKGEKMKALVLFSEGDVKVHAQPTGLRALLRGAAPDNDGFAEPRRLILSLAQRFPGKVLLVDGTRVRGKPAIEWRGNVGHLAAGADALEVVVDPETKTLFKVDARKVETASGAKRGQTRR
jgi:hypothetical protein